MSRTMSKHHLFWPRKKWPQSHRKFSVRIPTDEHMEYHEFYLHNCRHTEMVCVGCRFFNICCYAEIGGDMSTTDMYDKTPIVCRICRAKTPHKFNSCEHPCRELIKHYEQKHGRATPSP